MTEKSGICAVCGIEAKQFCSACKKVKYCGTDHQKKHWKAHKLDCRPFSIATDENLGRFLLATRDIKAKSVIFSETPLIVGPKWYLTEREEFNPIVPCVGCYTPVRIGRDFCPRCRWPACMPSCIGLENPKLHGLECPILMLGSGPPTTNDLREMMNYYRTDALVVLKCLMLQRKFPKKWAELMDMQSHETERLGSELYQDAERRVVSYLCDNYLSRLKSIECQSKETILQKCDANILRKICGIIETNYMCISLPNGLELSGIYYTACMMEHSCLPNCFFTFDHNNGFKISVIAGRDINKGEHLQIMYSNMLWGTQMRQEHLELTKHFLCQCQRCIDPTEMGSFLSGLKCIGNETEFCEGIQLPEDPLNKSTEWKCNICPMKINSEEIRYLLTQMGEEVDTLLSKKPTIAQTEELIGKLSQFLHKNHYHLFSLKHSLIQLYGKQHNSSCSSNVTNEILEKKLEMCEELQDICDKLDPYTIRLSLYVGIILYEKHSSLVEIGKRILNQVEGNEDQKKQIAFDKFKLARDSLLRAADILKKELDNVGGVKLSDAVIKAISNVDNIIANSIS